MTIEEAFNGIQQDQLTLNDYKWLLVILDLSVNHFRVGDHVASSVLISAASEVSSSDYRAAEKFRDALRDIGVDGLVAFSQGLRMARKLDTEYHMPREIAGPLAAQIIDDVLQRLRAESPDGRTSLPVPV